MTAPPPKRYTIISLGWFCGVSQELERRGLRQASFPFDWILSDIKGVEYSLDDSFKDFLNPDCLRQDKDISEHYHNDRLGFSFLHDFNSHDSLKKQLPEVKQKYLRRINRFKTIIKTPCFFIRYIKDKEEYDYLLYNRKSFEEKLKKYNQDHKFFYVVNSDIAPQADFAGIVARDTYDTVARKFMNQLPELELTLIELFSLKIILSNIMRFHSRKYDLSRCPGNAKTLINKIMMILHISWTKFRKTPDNISK